MSTLKRVLTASLTDNVAVEDYAVNLDALPVVSERALVECEVALDVCEYSMESLIALSADDIQGEYTETMRQIVATSALTPFGFSQEEISTVVVSQEGVVEKIKEMANAVWEFMKKMVAETIKFFDQHISNVGRMDKAFRALKEKAKDAKGNPKEKTLKSSKYGFFSLEGKGDTEVVSLVNQAAAIVNDVVANEQLNRLSVEFSKIINSKILALRNNENVNIDQVFSNSAALWNQGAVKALGLKEMKEGYGLDLPGEGRRLLLTAYTKGDYNTVAKVELVEVENKSDKVEIKAPTGPGVIGVCDSGTNLSKIMMGKKNEVRKMEKFVGALQGSLENILSTLIARAVSDKPNKELATQVITGIRRMATNSGKLNQIGVKEGYRVLVMAYEYAKSGYKNLDGVLANAADAPKGLPAPSN
jgi:hypothetical protein